MESTRADLKGLALEELERFLVESGEPRYRAKQLVSWIYEKDVTEFGSMTNLPAALREKLDALAFVSGSKMVTSTRSAHDGTEKLLLEYEDGARVEAVVLEDDGRVTGCVSTQVGCRLGCVFCATGAMGLSRNLTAGEIVEQIMALRRHVAPKHLDNIVFMGMGEPLDNYDATIKAIRATNAPWGLGIGARRMTVSTVGIVEGIRRLAREDLQVNLALSLNATDQELRQRLMPAAHRNPLPKLTKALQDYFGATGRMVTLEYVLLAGVNDSQEDANALARFAGELPCKINLICYNRIENAPFAPPTNARLERFLTHLRKKCPTVVRRISRGGDISAGCGQLHASQKGRSKAR
jgi:23S rRNA (adenine2503-C2)-methyltransferase